MIAPRRFLPSMSSLLALEAVGRLGTATAAADELALTHSAVSRQIKVLEEQLGAQLLRRQGRGLRLTAAGAEYAQSVRDCLQDLARASLRLKSNPSGGSLNLSILPAFGMHWLGPRLRAFADRHPDITINLGTRLASFDFGHEKFDAAVHFGQQDWQHVTYLELARERVLPVCAPALLDGMPSRPEVLLDMPLLHLESRPGAWEEWFERHGCRAGRLGGMLFDQFATMAQAAALGFGVALLPSYLAEVEIASGRLAPAFPEPLEVSGRYYLVWPTIREPRGPLRRLIEWLMNEGMKDPRPGRG